MEAFLKCFFENVHLFHVVGVLFRIPHAPKTLQHVVRHRGIQMLFNVVNRVLSHVGDTDSGVTSDGSGGGQKFAGEKFDAGGFAGAVGSGDCNPTRQTYLESYMAFYGMS